MIVHYFKVAFRSYSSNKTQSLITLFSLAIAFAFVSLATYWSHYEQTYDSFLNGYEKIHLVGEKQQGSTSISTISHYGFHSYLMSNYAEVDKACGIWIDWKDDRIVEINGQIIQAGFDKITPEAIDVFEIQWVEGNRNMESWNENEIAISEEIVQQVCGSNSPIGTKVILKKEDGIETVNEYRIAAVFKVWPQHSNFNFQILKKMVNETTPFHQTIYETYIRFKPNVDINLFLRKLESTPVINGVGRKITYNVLTPLSKVHYTFPKEERNLRLNDVKLFTGAAILLSVCALLNYLTLFVSRLRTKGRDMALRAICGSSSWQLGLLLMVEYLLLFVGSLLVSMVFIEVFYHSFVKLSQLNIDRSTLYGGCSYLLLFILGLSSILSLVPIWYFKQKTLRVQMEAVPIQLGKNRFRIAGVCLQLFISLFFIFCSGVMIKQIHYLIHADINVERKNIAWLSAPFSEDVMTSMLKQIPSVTEVVGASTPIFPAQNIHLNQIQGFEGQENLVISAREVRVNQDIARFYGLKMKEGPESFDLKKDEVLVNETFAKQLGDPNPIGKVFSYSLWNVVIKGIVYDFQYQAPTQPDRALYFVPELGLEYKSNYHSILAFKYMGDFAECQAAIQKAFEKLKPNPEDEKAQMVYNRTPLWIQDGETVYNSYLTSEFNLLKLLNIITVISLLIALFGVYALILQECERQRKSIAVRKVFGAQVKDILMMFFKEYMMQVVIAAALAFPIGYVLMKHWLEGYSRQTNIGIEVFLGIFLGMAILVLLCIGWHVWRAANENPATAVKKE